MAANKEQRLAEYLALQAERPADFTNVPGGVKIELAPERIAAIEDKIRDRYQARGLPGAWAEVGLCYQDPYLRLVRDAVVFPSGREAIHHRVLSNSDPSGSAMLPMHGDKAVLIRHFRHATRKWHWEIPRGGVDFGQSDQDTALTELREEIGAEVTELVPLGSVHGSTALISGSVSLFLARVSELGKPALDEAIVEIREVSIAEFEHMISGGEVDDSFTICAFLRARLRNLL